MTKTALFLSCLLLCSSALHAAPGLPTGDSSMLQRLHDKGLLPGVNSAATGPLLVQHMGEAASGLVLQAMNFLGVPYRRGGSSAEQGFDCSGFTRHVFEHSLGLVLPRRANEQAKQPGLRPVQRDELEPGDLVFFNTVRNAFSHVGIYVGEGRFIHAPRKGGEVRVEDMRKSYWAKRFNGARRADAVPGVPGALSKLAAPAAALPAATESVAEPIPTR